ncbi:undecaprenyl-phosphate alpha-N-acetylglucosaminyl 1-phosphate transferase [Cohnella xylanilytica]|uniref:Undecaprenyl/decaprenyl-phosphate alpha-N-acetylglucosaminyl 1-phosphate transferase n=1 Tax=Cohnella xylanilytica TaxID=557555 RepID=A0A841U326_9BACL|nr:MraY family glycosyltransferase [Cohnella xylanilytica]MBB6694179.1 undecaprenyl/decaprenyl-phosphate alpha-N-acetylglucosaminyl 1-phosphate transferase [Cohnella xylanilytica]GIO14915.1 undecaprenyl-phosphate alpha-N-acetylglucosaminyl 1-phosphate transferase [Cohnella xylanilytica]
MMYLYALGFSFLLVLLLVPIVRAGALRIGFVDRPARRKVHTKPVPLSGGVAIYAGVIATTFLFLGDSPIFRAIAVGGALLVAIGLVDDAFKSSGREFPVWPRLLIYIGVSLIPSAFGITIAGISAPSRSAMILFSPGWAAFFTALWVFSLINMLNFIDGIDGLASGVCVISSFTLFAASLIGNQSVTALIGIALAGACLAFLTYNFHPARIFMGDAGATFLGYTLAVTAIEGTLKGATFLSLFVPVLALGVPILDTVIVFSRRLLEGKGLHRADNLHTHHSLMRWGLTQVQTVSFLYLIAAVFSLMSIVILLMLR